jgi:hypothetical protein
MGQKEIIIKVRNDRIYLNPRLSIPIHQTNIPKEHLTFRSHEDIFWKVEMLDYNSVNRCLKVSVKEYSTSDIANFDKQEPNKPVNELIFERFDWRKLEPLLTYYHSSQLLGILFNIDTYPFSKGEKQSHVSGKPASVFSDMQPSRSDQQFEQKPTIKIIKEDFWIYFNEVHFMLGYVTFKKLIKEIGKELTFKVPNEYILAEFDNIKGWFAKKLKTKKFKVAVSITLTENEVTESRATSKQIEQITPELIDSVYYQRTIVLSKKPRLSNPDKSLFTVEEIFNQIDTNDIEGNVFNQSDEDILNFFLKESDVRNKKQLAYLAGKKQSMNYKLRYTLYPDFGFLFLIEGAENNHFVWELLNSHATYIWSTNKEKQHEESQFKRIETCVNNVRTIKREGYKRAYKDNHLDNDLIFSIISHEGIGSKLVDDFPKWKNKLNGRLT